MNFHISRIRHIGQFIRQLIGCVRLLLDAWALLINVVNQLADWMESYAQALELNVWTSAAVEKVGKGEKGQWNVTVRRGGPSGTVRTLHPTHVITAIGYVGKPHIPRFEGQVRLISCLEAKS